MSILQRRFNPREHAVKTDLYVSDFEQFLNWLKNDHPELGREQMLSRALRWDKLPQLPNSSDVAGKEGELKQPSYYYGRTD
jgi:hypothetical protein